MTVTAARADVWRWGNDPNAGTNFNETSELYCGEEQTMKGEGGENITENLNWEKLRINQQTWTQGDAGT